MASKAFIKTVVTLGLCESIGMVLYNRLPGASDALDRDRLALALVEAARSARQAYRAQQHLHVRDAKTARRIQMSLAALQKQCKASGPFPSAWISFAIARVAALLDLIKARDRRKAISAVAKALDAIARVEF